MSDEIPTLDVVRDKLVGLINGTMNREQVASWAWQWIAERDDEVTDLRLHDHLDTLSGADSKVDPETYLYDQSDFEDWLRDLPTEQ
ncbi:hypothetical protein [Streptomyces sp. NRRL F-5135]|uniref:hypothetical protein n=1 Tax=Streptomyces sp. NRRL F-5135 TaxID=1463858 RepID=UPI00131DA4E7|nr:hypothetical protein [Streptomyces sp. NRRL F-5135]